MSAFPIPAPTVLGPTLAKVRASASEETVGGEMESFPARWLADLPLPPRFGLHVPGIEGVVRVELSPSENTQDGSDVVFSREEWASVCRGVEADRIWPMDFAAICARKLANPAYRLELVEALAGVEIDESELWALGRVLNRVDAQLVSA